MVVVASNYVLCFHLFKLLFSCRYVAPEVLELSLGTRDPSFQPATGYGKSVDCWSLGVILYMLLCGEPPWPDSNFSNLCETVLNGAFTFPDALWGDVSTSAKRLVCRLLTVSPDKRITVDEALVHEWVTGLEGSPEAAVEFAVPSTIRRPRAREGGPANALLTLMGTTTAKSPNLKAEPLHSPAMIASTETTPLLTDGGGGGGVRLAFADENEHNSPTARKLAFGFETPEKKNSSVKKKLKTGE